MSKTFLIIFSILLVLMGILGLVPNLDWGTEPMWHAVAKIVIGIIGLIVAGMDKKKPSASTPAM